MAKRIRAIGRPPGSPNAKSEFPRDQQFEKFRCSLGFIKLVEYLVDSKKYKSKADVLHRALELLAAREIPADNIWCQKIQ